MNIKEFIIGFSYSSTIGPAIGLTTSLATALISLIRKIQSCVAKIKLSHLKIDNGVEKGCLNDHIFSYELAAEQYIRLSLILLISATPLAGFFLAQHYLTKPVRDIKIYPIG